MMPARIHPSQCTLLPRVTPRGRARQRGSVLIVVLLVVLMLGGLSAGLLSEGLADKAAVSQRKSNLVALEICEKGLVQSMMEIFSLTDMGVDGIGSVREQVEVGVGRVD